MWKDIKNISKIDLAFICCVVFAIGAILIWISHVTNLMDWVISIAIVTVCVSACITFFFFLLWIIVEHSRFVVKVILIIAFIVLVYITHEIQTASAQVILTVNNSQTVSAGIPLTSENWLTTRELFDDPIEFYEFIINFIFR